MNKNSLTRYTPVKRKRSGSPRRGRIRDKAYLEFIASLPCLVSGRRPVTVHHVRRFGEQKSDRRTVPLLAEFHMHAFGPYSIERMGKPAFEQMFGVDLEAAICRYNAEYEARRVAA